VLWALFNDVAQRIVTLNKAEQRVNVRRVFRELGHPNGGRVLDFGCGTGLFATTLAKEFGGYVGYDPDRRLVQYAARLYPTLTFTPDQQGAARGGPYDSVLANCCFHHIANEQVDGCLEFIAGHLQPAGHFVLIDILAPPGRRASFRQLWGLAERGDHLRSDEDYLRLLNQRFEVVRRDVTRAHILSKFSPLYSDLAIYICRPRPAGSVPVLLT